MFDSKEELLDKIALGEDTVLELKAVRFDEQVVATATIDDLDRPLYERFRGPQSRDTDGDLLHKLAMARPDDQGQLRPTVAGVLLATREPRNWVTNAFIQAVAYRGVSVVPDADAPSYQLDAADISGPRDAQVIDACHFVRKNMWVAAAKTAKAMGRRDLPQFDMVTVFEAVVNAVAHRDYSIYTSKIRLRMFADRLEISSPGALANSMSVESLAFRQSARNEAVSSLLAKCAVPGDQYLGTTRGGDSRGMERAAGSTDSARKEPVARSLRAAIQAEHHLQGEATR